MCKLNIMVFLHAEVMIKVLKNNNNLGLNGNFRQVTISTSAKVMKKLS